MRPLIVRDRDYRGIWAASAISSVGTQISAIAVPLAALLVLRSTTLQVSLISALETLPTLLIGLPAGAWVDRLPRRPLMILMDLSRAAALSVIPLCALFHLLSVWILYASAFVVGAASVVFDSAKGAFLPSIVNKDHLAAANGQLQVTTSVAYAVGPGLSGVLVQLITAPYAIALDAASYLWSAAWLTTIRSRETRPVPKADRASLRAEIAAGIRVITGSSILRSVGVYNAFMTFFLGIERAIEIIFLVRVVRVSPASVGFLCGIASVGAIAGGFGSSRVVTRLGTVRAMLGAAAVGNGFMLLVPLAAHGPRAALFAVGVSATSFGIVVFNVASATYLQQTIPSAMLGRTGATMTVMSWIFLPVGAVVGGVMGTALGLRATLWICAVGGILAVAWLIPLGQRRSAEVAADRDATGSVTSA